MKIKKKKNSPSKLVGKESSHKSPEKTTDWEHCDSNRFEGIYGFVIEIYPSSIARICDEFPENLKKGCKTKLFFICNRLVIFYLQNSDE